MRVPSEFQVLGIIYRLQVVLCFFPWEVGGANTWDQPLPNPMLPAADPALPNAGLQSSLCGNVQLH